MLVASVDDASLEVGMSEDRVEESPEGEGAIFDNEQMKVTDKAALAG